MIYIGCVMCGDSGVLNILCSRPAHASEWDNRPYASSCHACPAGATWREAGLE